jgi:hypothetical protein
LLPALARRPSTASSPTLDVIGIVVVCGQGSPADEDAEHVPDDGIAGRWLGGGKRDDEGSPFDAPAAAAVLCDVCGAWWYICEEEKAEGTSEEDEVDEEEAW